LDRVEIGAAVRYEEQPSGDPDWIVLEDTTDPSLELKETSASSRIAKDLIGKKAGDTFVLAPGMIDRRGVIRQIVPKYVRAYNDCGDRWQIRFPEEPMIQSMHLGKTEEEVRESIEKMLQALQKQAENGVEMRKKYNTVSTPLHVLGKWHGKNSYHALIALASEDEQPVRTSFGNDDERKASLEALKESKMLVLDLSAFATIRLLELDFILTSSRFRFQMTANSWQELRESLRELKTDTPSIAVGYKDGQQVMLEETVEFKEKRAAANRAFLETVEKCCEVVPVQEVASLAPDKRDQFEQMFGQYGVETMLAAARPDALLWSDDLVQSQIAFTEFGTRKVWTQMLVTFLAEQNVISAEQRDTATAKLIGMEYRVTFFDAPSFVEAVHLTGATPWEQPLKTFIRELSAPEADLRILFPIIEECIVRIYRESLLPENRCRVTTALLDAMWKNPAARRSILNLRAKSARMFLLNPVGESQFNGCFDQWLKLIENPIITG
jgi:hypothetical protein